MENSWQRKCGGSGWQSLQEQHQNQILNGNLHFHSSARAKPSSPIRRLAPEAVSQWGPSLTSNNMGLAEQGYSFLSLLSGPPCITSNEVLMSGSHASVCATGTEVSHLSSGPFIGSTGGRHAVAGADLGWVGLSKARVNPNQDSSSGPNGFVQGCQRDSQPMEIPKKADTQPKLSSNETQTNISYPRMGCLGGGGATAPNVWKSHAGNTVGASQRVAPKTDSSVSCLSSSMLTTGPRVFCLGLSGDLLLSSSVLLGVVCLCHGLHMSIAKFAEHSGSCNVNPGIAVHVDGGETIAHWRKVYFHKIGIRIPEDHIGWDWPQGLSVTAGLLQHGPTPPKLFTGSDFYNQVSAFGASMHSVNQLNCILTPKNPQFCKNVNEFVNREKPKSATEDSSVIFKSLTSSTKNNLQFAADDHMTGFSRTGSSGMPSLIGARNAYNLCPPISSCKDSIRESGNSALSNWQKLNVLGKDVAIARSGGSLVEDRVSSNVELRLGQPSQQNQVVASGSSVIPVSGSHPIFHCQPRKSVFLDQHMCRTSTPGSTEESRQHGYFAGIMPSSSVRAEKTELNDLNGASRVPNASQLKIFNKSACGSVTTSESFTNLRSPCEEKNCLEFSNNAISVNHAVISNLHSGPSPINPGQFGYPYLREKITDTEFCISRGDSRKHQKAFDGLHGTAEPNFESHAKSMAQMWSFGGFASDNGHSNYPVLRDKVSNLCQFTDMTANVPDKYFGQVSYPVHNGSRDLNSFKAISSPLELGTIVSSQALSLGKSATNSFSMKSFVTPCNNENTGMRPYLLGESSKVVPFQSMSALSDDILVAGTSKTTPHQGKSQNYYEKTQVIIPPVLSGMQKNVFKMSHVSNASEVATCSLVSPNLTIEESEKLPSVSGKWCNFQVPAVSQGCYSHGKDVEAQFCSDLEQARQFFMRMGGNANVASSSKGGNCYQESLHGCLLNDNNSRKSDWIPERHDLLGNPSPGEFGDKEGPAVNLVAPFSGPKLSEIYTFSEKTNSFATKSVVQDMKKVELNTFEWRDVPRKVVKDAKEGATKCDEKSAHHSSKEHEMSNISSGCSAPAVTQVSTEANNKDSSTVDGALKDNLVLDEGSRIERCCSSDEDSEKSAEFCGFTSKFNLMDKCPSKASVSKPSHSLKDELQFRDTLKFTKFQSQTGSSFPIQTNGNMLQNLESESRRGKRSIVKRKRLDSSGTASVLLAAHNETSKCGADTRQLSLDFKNLPTLSQGDQQSFTDSPCLVGENLKRISRMSSFDVVSRKRGLNLDIHVDKTHSATNLNAQNDYSASEAMQRKRSRLVGDAEGLEQEKYSNCTVSEISDKGVAVDCNTTSGKLGNACHGKKPVVCGKYGVIFSANSLKPPKIVSLRTVMKAARRYSSAENKKLASGNVKESKKGILNATKELKDGVPCVVSTELNSLRSGEGSEESYFLGSEDSSDMSHTMKKRRYDGKRSHTIPDIDINPHLRRRYKQIRKRSINELTVKGDDSNCLKHTILNDGACMQSIKSRFVSNANDSRMSSDENCNNGKHAEGCSCKKSQDSGVPCCVCGSSSTDDSNCLLECHYCFIKVHQACYGVSMVPKAQWYCRPCKTSCKNIVCVLCGYGGGAMTRAIRTHNVVKSLLKAWGFVTESHSRNLGLAEPLGNSYKMLPSTKSVGENDPFLIIRPAQMESNSVNLLNSDLSNHVGAVDIPSSAPAASVCNSIIAGVFDSTVKQWVHMVCGLWTPDTCCPNVDTMSAFDVSEVCNPKQDVVCSICQRSGGTCIQCRVADCHVQFHPWCAHQKGLLQSEVEGVDNQSVGFYGRCMLHEMYQQFDSGNYHTSSVDHGERESTCARTEGYKGRKRDGFYDNHGHNSDAGSGCLVPQEQLNAWIHINGQKSSVRGPLKPPTSVVEHDCRKEYARYKQSRGWKHLVVYKSGIHGLGLYTSQFIYRGAMVVEYVGEIVGAHVADKRETEYQAGKKLQYKSACYFFRIDKEHIIDATRKGGIARFVNHSCAPNCVAKVISVRNEKKVVFFAERDIYPGEEVTYDYHFNHEDEGKKLACYCKAKNCRRFLN